MSYNINIKHAVATSDDFLDYLKSIIKKKETDGVIIHTDTIYTVNGSSLKKKIKKCI